MIKLLKYFFARDMLEWDKAVKESGPAVPLAHIVNLTTLSSLTVYD